VPKIDDLKELATDFHKWMEDHFKYSLAEGAIADQNIFFLHYIESNPKAMETVISYDDLCTLANLVREYEYDINNPPCTNEEFIDLKVHDMELDDESEERSPPSSPNRGDL
jgi:hypothetical protein